MKKSPTFMVFHLRELIYTAIFVLLGIVLIITLVIMFSTKQRNKEEVETSGKYEPGVYTSCVTLNGNPMDITVTLDANHINAIELKNVSSAVTTMYPLIQPSFDDIADQIISTQSTENIKFDASRQYTYAMLYNEINDIITNATNKD